MRNNQQRLSVFGLIVVSALSLTAFSATGAQGQLPGESTAGVITVNSGAALLATLAGEQVGVGYLEVPGRNVKTECASYDLEEAKIINSKEGLGKLTLLECTARDLKGTLLPCEVLDLKGTAIIRPTKHNGVAYLLSVPDGSDTYTIKLFEGGECPLPLSNPIKGSVSGQIINNNTVEPSIISNKTIQELTGDKLTFGGFPAYLIGTVKGTLTGAHLGQKFGVE